MKINCSSRVLSSLKRIHVLFRNSLAKIHIVATSSPKPTTTPWNEQFNPLDKRAVTVLNSKNLTFIALIHKKRLKHFLFKISLACAYMLTEFAVSRTVTSAVVQISKTTVSG